MINTYVAYVIPSKPTAFYNASSFESKTCKQIIEEYKIIENQLLFISTPLFCEALETDCIPLTRYPKLKLFQQAKKYDRPDYYILQNLSSYQNILKIKVEPIQKSCYDIPAFYSSFDLTIFNNNTLRKEDIIKQIEKDFVFEVTNSSIYFDNFELTDSTDSITILAHAKTEPLYFSFELTDKAIGKIKHRVYALEEIISTEKTYVSDLTFLIDFWENEMRTAKMLSDEKLQVIFKDLYAIQSSQKFFLENIIQAGTKYSSAFAPPFIEFAPFFKASQLYVSNYPSIIDLINNSTKKAKFATKMQKIVRKTDGRDIFSYLITPVQRMPRYILFLRDLIKITPSSHPDSEFLPFAYSTIEAVTQKFDSATAQAKKQTELMKIQQMISNKFVFLDRQRELLYQFPISINDASKLGTIYLFKDLILVLRNHKTTISVLYDSEVDVFRCLYQWPTIRSITFDASQKSYVKRKKIFEIIFNKDDDRLLFIEEVKHIQNRLIKKQQNLLNSKFNLIWENVEMKKNQLPLIRPKIVAFEEIPYIFSNNQIIRFDDLSEMTIVGSLPNVNMVTSNKNSIYAISNDSLIEFNPNNNYSLTKIELNKKIPLLRGATMVSHEDSLIIFGGKSRKEYSNNVIVIDLQKREVFVHESMNGVPSPRWQHSSLIYRNQMIVYGGSANRTMLSNSYVLDLETYTWSSFAATLPPRRRHNLLNINNKFIVSIGGTTNKTLIIDANDNRNEVSTVFEIGNYSNSLPYASAIILQKKIFVVNGGKDKRNMFASILAIDVPENISNQFLNSPLQPKKKTQSEAAVSMYAVKKRDRSNKTIDRKTHYNNNVSFENRRALMLPKSLQEEADKEMEEEFLIESGLNENSENNVQNEIVSSNSAEHVVIPCIEEYSNSPKGAYEIKQRPEDTNFSDMLEDEELVSLDDPLLADLAMPIQNNTDFIQQIRSRYSDRSIKYAIIGCGVFICIFLFLYTIL